MKTAKIKKLDKETVQTTKTVEVVHTVNIPAVIEELNKMRNELVFDTNKLIDQEKCLTSAFERYNNLIDDVISANEELEIE